MYYNCNVSVADKSFRDWWFILSSNLFQQTLLHIAVGKGDVNIVRTLLGQEVDTNIKDGDGVILLV